MKYIIKSSATYEEKINKSRFIGHISPLETGEEAYLFIKEIKAKHPQASHNCPAFIFGKSGDICFSSDDGEPSGTAGKPILNMLQRHNLTNTVIVVTRYYGGVNLGIRGLIDAYGSTAEKTIQMCEKEPLLDIFRYNCHMNYDVINIFKHRMSQIPDVAILDTVYTDKIDVVLSVSELNHDELKETLIDMQNKKQLAYYLLSE